MAENHFTPTDRAACLAVFIASVLTYSIVAGIAVAFMRALL